MKHEIILYFSFPTNFIIAFKFNKEILFGEKEEMLLRAYVPGVCITKTIKKDIRDEIDLFIIYRPSKIQKILHKGNTIFIHDNWSKEIPIYLFHLIYSVSHQILLKKDYYTIHSVCVGKKNTWTLLIGHTGVGKTSVMLELLYNHEFEMFSSNKTLVKFNKKIHLEAVAGTTTVTCKNDEHNKIKVLIEQSTSFVNRIASKLPDKYITSNQKVTINRIYFTRLNPAVEECARLDDFESLVALYPFFLDHINSDIILFDGGDLYDGALLPTRTKKRMLSSLKNSLNSLEVYTLNGSLDFVSKTIEKHYEKI